MKKLFLLTTLFMVSALFAQQATNTLEGVFTTKAKDELYNKYKNKKNILYIVTTESYAYNILQYNIYQYTNSSMIIDTSIDKLYDKFKKYNTINLYSMDSKYLTNRKFIDESHIIHKYITGKIKFINCYTIKN